MIRYDFDVAGREIWIFRAWHTRSHSTRNLDHIFAAQTVPLLRNFCVFFRAKDNLRQTFAIPQINEDDSAMVTRDMHPTGERDLPADIAFPKGIAIVRAIHVLCHVERSRNTSRNYRVRSFDSAT